MSYNNSAQLYGCSTELFYNWPFPPDYDDSWMIFILVLSAKNSSPHHPSMKYL